jgi:hypothetical protein
MCLHAKKLQAWQGSGLLQMQLVSRLRAVEWGAVRVQRMSPQTHPFRASRQGAPNFCLASIATMTDAAATVTTHHHHQNSHAPHLKVLCSCCGKTFCIGHMRVSIHFGTHRSFWHVKNFDDKVDGDRL